jgi:hypothetical protein
MSGSLWAQLEAHLFPGDGDEHGAVIAAGIVQTARGTRLLARELHLARDGVDYVPGERGYRMLTPTFVRDQILRCRDGRVAYLAVHCHGGIDRVGFSSDDLRSHERGYPALVDLLDGQVVGGLVFARNAVAGDIWLANGRRVELSSATIVGRPIRTLFPMPRRTPTADPTYDRQARIFGDRGQHILRRQKVAIIGAGGSGSLLVEYLARLGVGNAVVIDPQRIEPSNLPRVVGSRRWDAHTWLTADARPELVRRLGTYLANRKVRIARRLARQANSTMGIEAIVGSIVDDDVAQRLIDCDYLFLAADSMQARLVFNAIVHQYLIPGVQVGSKVTVDHQSGTILDIFSVMRPVTPDLGCLWCNGLINPAALQDEALSEEQRRHQRYIDEPTVTAPSVITLNAVSASHAADDYMFAVTGLLDPAAPQHYLRFTPMEADAHFERPRKDAGCRECGAGPKGRLGRGQGRRLPTR